MTEAQATAAHKLEWGHPLITPEGTEIRVPKFAYAKLERLGLLIGRRNVQLSPMIYGFLQPEHDCITDGLRHLLGKDLTGPEWLVCNCMECQQKQADLDHTPDPRVRRSVNDQAVDRIVDEVKRKRRIA